MRYTKSHDIHTLSGSCNLVSGLVHPRYRWTHPTYTTGFMWGYDLLTSCDFRDEEIIDLQPIRLQVGTANQAEDIQNPCGRSGLVVVGFSTHRKTYVSGDSSCPGVPPMGHLHRRNHQMYSMYLQYILSVSHCSLPSRP